jgi:hypothetical protein
MYAYHAMEQTSLLDLNVSSISVVTRLVDAKVVDYNIIAREIFIVIAVQNFN